jgi:hypothetical protein
MFRWHLDSDGDITLLCAGVVALTFYKTATPIVTWFPKDKYFPVTRPLYHAMNMVGKEEIQTQRTLSPCEVEIRVNQWGK